jgi:hypothetical protein
MKNIEKGPKNDIGVGKITIWVLILHKPKPLSSASQLNALPLPSIPT